MLNELPGKDGACDQVPELTWQNASQKFHAKNSAGHGLFFNYAFQILAIDVLPRNCYLNEGNLLPFDVSSPESMRSWRQCWGCIPSCEGTFAKSGTRWVGEGKF